MHSILERLARQSFSQWIDGFEPGKRVRFLHFENVFGMRHLKSSPETLDAPADQPLLSLRARTSEINGAAAEVNKLDERITVATAHALRQ